MAGSGRWSGFLTVLAIGSFVLACDARSLHPSLSAQPDPTPTTWDLDLVSLQEDLKISVVVRDRSGRVTGAASEAAGALGVASRNLSVATAGPDPALIVAFSASPCTESAVVDVSDVGSAILVALTLPDTEDCDGMAVTYSMRLGLSSAFERSDLVAHDSNSDASSWGLVAPSADGLSRPILIVDRTRATQFVSPLNPAVIQATPGSVSVTNRPGDERVLQVIWSVDRCDDEVTVEIDQLGDALRIRVTLARVSERPCGGPQFAQGIWLAFSRDVPATLVETEFAVKR